MLPYGLKNAAQRVRKIVVTWVELTGFEPLTRYGRLREISR
jgi:hypothetical protein